MSGNVRRLDTINFGPTIQAYANHVRTFEGIVSGVNSTTSAALNNWKGKGRDAFKDDCDKVQQNLKDIAEIMNEIREALRKAHEGYKETDRGVASDFKG